MPKVFIDDCPNGAMRQHEWENGVCLHCKGELPDVDTQFAQRLERLLNAHSRENASNTPDFILAQYLLGCLAVWNETVNQRERWYGRNAGFRPASAEVTQQLGPIEEVDGH